MGIEQQHRVGSATGDSGRIMIVDDNPDNLHTLKAMLEAHGYKTFAAISGELALGALSKVHPELILLDIMMPDMDGYEVCRRLKADEQTQDIPVLFMSALNEPMEKLQAFEVGGLDYIPKPFETEEVLARVRTHLELYQMRHHLEQMVASRTHALQESEGKYRRLVEGLKDEYFFYVHDVDGVFSYLSPSIKQVLGYTVDEFMTYYTEYLTDNPINQQAREYTEQSILGIKQPAYELEIFNKDGKPCWLAVKETPLLDDTGNVTSVEGIAHDITARKLANEVLLTSQQHLEEAQQLGHIGSWELDYETNKLLWSKEIYNIFGVDEAKFSVTYQAFMDTVHPDDREKVNTAYAESVKNKTFYVVDHRLRMPDGTIKYVHERGKTVYDDEGHPINSTGTVQDITENILMEESLRRSEKMDALGKLTGGIAHDFNNVLGVILGYSELLRNSLSSEPKLEKYVGEIYDAGERARKLTSKLLAFSRKETTSAEVSDINAVIQGQQHLLEKTLTARIKLETKLAENLWPVWLDKSSLEDAILNMSINALHAMKDGGNFSLETQNAHLGIAETQQMDIEPGDYVLLSLTDTGIGMDEMTQQQIFEPFFSTKGDKGTGLGMSQVYGFVKQSNGTIRLYSEPEHGSQFTIYFPRYVESRAVDSVHEVADSVEMPVGNESILVVDDEAPLRELAKEILTNHGYRVLCAEGGVQALDILKTETVDLLLTDVIMPDMDGYQLAAEVERRYPDIVIQVVSGFSDGSHEGLANKELHKQRLHKPFSSDALLQRIRKQLDERTKHIQDTVVKASTEFGALQYVEWSEDYSTGIDAIDTDHKIMMSLINRCTDVINSGSEDRKEIRLILDKLLDYKRLHFQREECIMTVCGYPDLNEHKKLHQTLAREVEDKLKEFGLRKLATKSLFNFLINWITEHVIDEKKLFSTCGKGKEELIDQALIDSGLDKKLSDN